MTEESRKKNGQKFGKTVWEDLRDSNIGDTKKTLSRDFKDLYYYYLDDETREKLAGMTRFRKYFFMTLWILKSMILKLTTVRRLLLVASIFLFVFGLDRNQQGNSILGFLLLFLDLILEVKDKLLAADELSAGRAVQFALMPERKPVFRGWDIWLFTTPANDVGGDLVDSIYIEENRLGISIGDVAGKGLGAALLMARLQAAVRALAPTLKSLPELADHLNRIFCRDCLPSHFASLVYLELNPDTGRINFFNAGHMPPVLLKKGTIEEMPQGDTALGLSPDTEFREMSVELNTGDTLIVYSDGITEARNEKGEFYGEQRFFEELKKYHSETPESIGIKLISAIEQFTGDAKHSDDLSLVILKRTS